MTAPLYAGIDAGGTSTRCVVADERGVIRGMGHAGPGNALLGGHAGALTALRAALQGALAGSPDQNVAHLHVAAAGTAVPEGLGQLATSWSSSNDAPAAFSGALITGPGVIVIAGTGSACYGERASGESLLLGGWGPLAGDEGSGYAIGHEALKELAFALDRRAPHGLLVTALLRQLQVENRTALLTRLYSPPLPRDEVAALASHVTSAAKGGDLAARRLLTRAGNDLGRAAADTAIRLGLQGAEARVATLGGAWAAGPLLLAPFRRRLQAMVPGARVVPPRFPPVIGALLLAYRHARLQVDETILEHLASGITPTRPRATG